MQIKKLYISIFSITFFSICFNTTSKAIFDLSKFIGKEKEVEFVFLTNIEAKKNQLEKLEKDLSSFSKRHQEANKEIIRKLNIIQTELEQVQEKIKTTNEKEQEYLNKKIKILNDRKQNLTQIKELWNENKGILEKNIKIINDIIETLAIKKIVPELKLVYSWKEFKDAQNKFAEQIAKIETEKSIKDNLFKQKIAEKENIFYQQKQKTEKNKEKETLYKPIKEETEKEEISEEKVDIEILANILKNELNLIDEKIEYSNLKQESLNHQIRLKENEIELLENLAKNTKKLLSIIEKRLILDKSDVELAKTELDNETQKSLKIKSNLNKQKKIKIDEKEKLLIQIEKLKSEEKQVKDEGDESEIYYTQSKLSEIENKIDEVDCKLKWINSKKELADINVSTANLQYQIIDIYHKVNIEKVDASIIETLKNQKDIVLNLIKQLNDKRDTGANSFLEATRNINNLNVKKEEIKNKRDTTFKDKKQTFNKILNNISQAQYHKQNQLKITQEYLTVIADSIIRQQKIINQYDFIINDLETRLISVNIWKRSHRAISFVELSKSFSDSENFFNKLFWETPSYLNPISLLNAIKQFGWKNYLGFFIFILFFLVTFLGIKKLLLFLQKNIHKNKFLQQKKYLSLILESLIEFSLKNFKLLFSWFFIFLHIIFNFKYLFAFLAVLANPYSLSIFYLISIPILIYLSSQLISNAKDLNKKLSYLFFTEKTQSKFLFLITTILYSTSILIPLRQAFLYFGDIESEFPNVILAAYSLILVILILFFFSKEDVLTLLPSKGKLFIWLKEKIDKYYYPVFIFFMGLLILSNPYIGYSNLAWYLAFAVPSSVFLIYGIFFIHFYLRKYSVTFFLKEEDEEIKDKFDHAKTYYGFFIVISFLVLLFFTFILITRIWRFDYNIASTWKALSEDWVLPIEPKLGIVQFLILITFIASGFLISSLIHKFVLNKLFDILRTEPGTQNTIFRISHYLIIGLTLILGFVTIRLEYFIFSIGGLLVLGVGFGLKDLITDFIAGFFVLIERSIEIGNFIQLDENTMGTVHKISARATTIRTARNFSLIIPNKDIISKPIINWSQGRRAVGLELIVLVSYESDPEFVKTVLTQTIHNHPAILKIPAINLRLEDFEDNGMKFFVRAFVSARRVLDQWEIASDLRFSVIKEFSKNNIIIPFPQHVIHFSKNDENQSKPVKAIEIKFDQEVSK
ncbi:mechanosensitive ion channel [Candidatus Babeliales bacterium]|nr:mechanosensitive ion channel [Candidatus Babeliales bacterium]